MRRATSIIVSSVVAASVLATNNVANADALGKIIVNTKIQCDFKGDIYVMIDDSHNNRKLVLLSQSNGYQSELDNLNAGAYKIKEIHVFDIDGDGNRKELSNASYQLEYDNLDISEINQHPVVNLSLYAKDLSIDSDKGIDNKEIDSESSEDEQNDTSSYDEEKEAEKDEKNKKSVARRKKIYFINFVIDAVLILGLGAIWFFKIRKSNKEDE